MGYVEANLQKDEKIVLRAKLSKKFLLAEIISQGIKGIILLILTIILNQEVLSGIARLFSEEMYEALQEGGLLFS